MSFFHFSVFALEKKWRSPPSGCDRGRGPFPTKPWALPGMHTILKNTSMEMQELVAVNQGSIAPLAEPKAAPSAPHFPCCRPERYAREQLPVTTRRRHVCKWSAGRAACLRAAAARARMRRCHVLCQGVRGQGPFHGSRAPTDAARAPVASGTGTDTGASTPRGADRPDGAACAAGAGDAASNSREMEEPPISGNLLRVLQVAPE